MADLIKDFWGMVFAALGAMAWLIRLESKIALNSAAIQRLEQQRHEDMIAAREARAATNEGLREIRGDLGEIRGDIKTLLRTPK